MATELYPSWPLNVFQDRVHEARKERRDTVLVGTEALETLIDQVFDLRKKVDDKNAEIEDMADALDAIDPEDDDPEGP